MRKFTPVARLRRMETPAAASRACSTWTSRTWIQIITECPRGLATCPETSRVPGRGRTPRRDRLGGRTPGRWPGPGRGGRNGGCGPGRWGAGGSDCSERPRDYSSITLSDRRSLRTQRSPADLVGWGFSSAARMRRADQAYLRRAAYFCPWNAGLDNTQGTGETANPLDARSKHHALVSRYFRPGHPNMSPFAAVANRRNRIIARPLILLSVGIVNMGASHLWIRSSGCHLI